MQTYKTGGKKMEFRITETDVYGEDAFFYFTFEGYEKEKKIISGINYVSHEMLRIPEKTALVMLEENQEFLRSLPKVADLPQPLKELVLRQYDSLSGMLFLESNEEFWEKYTEEDLEKLWIQVEQYDLEGYIELFDIKRNNIPDNVDVVTCYMGLSSKFNFVGIR